MKVTFDFARQQISIEGNEAHLLEILAKVREIAPSLPQIQITANTAKPVSGVAGSAPPSGDGGVSLGQNGQGGGQTLHSGQTLRQFARALQLDNTSEKIAAVGYYMKTHEDRQSFSPKEMGDWFGICGFQKPSQMPVAMFDAKRKHGYVESSVHGQWRLTRNGENLVIGKLNEAESSQSA